MRLIRYAWALSRRASLVGIGSAVVQAVGQVALPIAIGTTIGLVVSGDAAASSMVVWLTLLFVCSYCTRMFTAWATREILDLSARDQLVRLGSAASCDPKLARLESTEHRSRMTLLESRLSQLDEALGYLLGPLVPTVASLVGGAVVLVALGLWEAGLLLLVAIGIDGGWLAKVSAHENRDWAGFSGYASRADYAASVALRREAAKEVRIFGLTTYLRTSYVEAVDMLNRALNRIRMRGLGKSGAAGVVRLAGILGATLWISTEFSAGAVPVSGFATAMPIVLMLGMTDIAPVRTLWLGTDVLDQLDDSSNLPPLSTTVMPRQWPVRTPTDAVVGDPFPPTAIELEGVSFRYPAAAHPVFQDVSLTFKANEAHAVVGVNGVGKTTLLKLIAGAYAPTAGRILVDGRPLAHFTPTELELWQRSLAVVAQESIRAPISIRESIEVGRRAWRGTTSETDDSVLDEIGDMVGLSSLVAKLPDGWDTPLGSGRKNGVDLSGGEWQKVALARAIRAVQEGRSVLLMDEPLSALDATSEAEIVHRYLGIVQDVTSIIVSHRLSVVKVVPHITVLGPTGVVEQGDHGQLIRADGSYAAMFRAQARQYSTEER